MIIVSNKYYLSFRSKRFITFRVRLFGSFDIFRARFPYAKEKIFMLMYAVFFLVTTTIWTRTYLFNIYIYLGLSLKKKIKKKTFRRRRLTSSISDSSIIELCVAI